MENGKVPGGFTFNPKIYTGDFGTLNGLFEQGIDAKQSFQVSGKNKKDTL